MLSKSEAIKIIDMNIPGGTIKKVIEFRDMFVFMVYTSDKLEGKLDPFYSVNRVTSQFEGFPMMKPENFSEVMRLFSGQKFL